MGKIAHLGMAVALGAAGTVATLAVKAQTPHPAVKPVTVVVACGSKDSLPHGVMVAADEAAAAKTEKPSQDKPSLRDVLKQAIDDVLDMADGLKGMKDLHAKAQAFGDQVCTGQKEGTLLDASQHPEAPKIRALLNNPIKAASPAPGKK